MKYNQQESPSGISEYSGEHPSVDDIQWKSFSFTDLAVLCFIRRKGKLLLIHKKRGLGAGKINAPGGRLEPGETAVQAAIRETEEETGLIPASLTQMGELSFVFTNGYSLFVTVFTAEGLSGELVETEEALPFWCDETGIPYERMWEDDQHWLPSVLAGKYIRGFFVFHEDRMISDRILIEP